MYSLSYLIMLMANLYP